ncbi:MAG TPA: hypothetical protein VGK47_12565, partial [Nitrososphaeraceae archaeon]
MIKGVVREIKFNYKVPILKPKMAAITRVKEGELNDSHSSTDKWNTIISKAQKFLGKTQEHALQGVNPGGVY